MAASKPGGVDPSVQLVLKRVAEARTHHDTFVSDIERLDRAFKGIVELRSEAAAWTAKYHPKYIRQTIESMVAAIADPRAKTRIRPRPRLGDDIPQMQAAAKTLENLVNYSLDVDCWSEKQRPWIMQALVHKMTVAKVYWDSSEGEVKSLARRPKMIYDDSGAPVDVVNQLGETSSYGKVKDGPCVEIRDVRDFMWPESAVDVQSAAWVIDRVWVTPEDAKALAKSYGVAVDDLTEDSFKPPSEEREQIQGKSRTKNLLPVLEYWTNDRVVTVLNDKILLRDDSNPYWHGKKPFVVTSGMPEPFQFAGASVVELMADLQEMLWSLQNQRIDGLRLLTNPIWLMRADLADIDLFEWAPGAIWPVEDTSQAKPLEINPALANMTLDAEALIKADLQNIPGGALFSGADNQTIDQTTATGVSIVTSIAQKLVQARQMNFRYGQREIVEQVGQLLQQFMREPQIIEISGSGSEPSWLQVDPTHIQGRFDFVADTADESTIRQERQAEAQARAAALTQIQQTSAIFGVVFDWKKIGIDTLEAFGVDDAETYILPPQAQAAAPQQQQPAGPPGQGVTSPLATAPTAPSNGQSLNPAVQMQQALASTGGFNNAG
jgi:hypothetical protein